MAAGAPGPSDEVKQAVTPLPAGRQGLPRSEAEDTGVEGEKNSFKKVLLLLRNHSAVDFSLYKVGTIQRRINRRMVLSKLTTLDAYARILRANPKELEALHSDLLINVTGFFRNPEAFEVLKRSVFPELIRDRRDDRLRVWVLGCSTGQEAYSLAMAFTEFSDRVAHSHKFQVFATDVNQALLDKARAGLYPKTLVQDVSPERLRRFFLEENGGYRITKGSTLLLCQWLVHRDPRFYDDPDGFRPERWTDEFQRNLPPYAYFPFGGGPRVCIGQQFAMMELVLILATIGQKFRFRLQPGASVTPLPTFTLRPVPGIPGLIEPR